MPEKNSKSKHFDPHNLSLDANANIILDFFINIFLIEIT